jgi:hypothetical protein
VEKQQNGYIFYYKGWGSILQQEKYEKSVNCGEGRGNLRE